ncbi:MAG: PKD domain-containing protein [Promethearchaeota archaeon]
MTRVLYSTVKYYTATCTEYITSPNYAPNTPTISGPSTGYENQLLTFGFKTTDPEGDSVSYQIDWGDSSISNLGFSASGTWVYMNHRYIHTGTYYIKVRAKDEYGLWSSWSSGHRIDITEYGPF